MSGIVGIVSGGRPVDADGLRRMTASLAFRGPDRRSFRVDGSVGLGHAALTTRDERGGAEQPATLDGRVWITADARLDGRDELVARLGSEPSDARTLDDSRLILHAYLKWGDRCVEFLLGDFAFAIWDGVRRRLFCARDHFGVKPFYYAETTEGFVFSNTLDCVRSYPAVDDALDELAIADFLLFGHNLEDCTTTFAGIRRLPAAHTLTLASDLRTRRYWTIPTDGRIRYPRPEEYVEHFRDVFGKAVSDRVTTSNAGIWMSGGLDSTAIAATARQVAGLSGRSIGLRAHTIVYDSLIADQERTFAGIAAAALDLETDVFVADRFKPFEEWHGLSTPEPIDDPFFVMRSTQLREVARSSRVLLSGEGGDELLWSSYVVDLLRRMPAMELARAVIDTIVQHRRRPGLGLRRWMKRRVGRGPAIPPFPAWVDPHLADRHDLRARWAGWHSLEPIQDHPLRPEAHGRLAIAPWAWYFEAGDPGVTGVPVELRYPFLDVRLVDYLLALPPVPWCVDKHLLRVAMRDLLPGVIRDRPKAAMAGDPLAAHMRLDGIPGIDGFEAVPELSRFVDRDAVTPIDDARLGEDPVLKVRPYCLNHWLVRSRTGCGDLPKESVHVDRTAVHAG